jgi:hypothetical protein
VPGWIRRRDDADTDDGPRAKPDDGTVPRHRRMDRRRAMTQFAKGDHVQWNSEAGMVSGVITDVHTQDVEYKGHMRRCSPEDPQYEIRSDKTDHVAMHKGGALSKVD